MPKQSHGEVAAKLIADARSLSDPTEAQNARLEAITFALLEVASELWKVSDSIGGVKMALDDADGFGAGIHMRHISEWLEKIADR